MGRTPQHLRRGMLPAEASGITVMRRVSDSDPSVSLISTFRNTWLYRTYHNNSDPQTGITRAHPSRIPRPRVSLQIYYTGAQASDPDHLERVARALESVILHDRNDTRDEYERDRLDVYGLPGASVERCISHQSIEIAAREAQASKEWYIQRYDIGGSSWRSALVIVRDVDLESTENHVVGLSTVYFDRVREDGERPGEPYWERRAENLNDQWVLIHELKHMLNWQHSASQFDGEGERYNDQGEG
ncbi:hypothetical protein F4860DRAFT_307732 [Xylaria cubensis]|nr:hypothetical protein F4860DRAFT_307732 [Xylaria cubensis]